MARPTRATRGVHFRQQPTKRFALQTKAGLQDGHALAASERVGNSDQGYLGPVIEGKIPYITTTSRADFLSAFNKRVNYHTDDRMDRNMRGVCVSMIRKLLPRAMEPIVWDPELYRQWVCQFDSEKQQRMEKVYDAAGLDRLSDYSNKQIFTKIESLVKDFEVVAPRIIFKGTDLYNMISGPIFKVLLERFCQLEHALPNLSFRVAYRQHTEEIVEFLEHHSCKSFIEADFSSNDKSQVKDVIELECMFMRRLGCPLWFIKLHKSTNKFSAYNTKFGISAVVENQLPSGATDGTFRNTFWNLCIFNCWMRTYKVPNAVAVFLGDDMLAGLPSRVRRAARHYAQVATKCRMDAKVTTHPMLHNSHFLSKHFVPVCRGERVHVMLPYIGKVLSKFNTRPNSNQAVSDDEYMAGKALSHCYEYRFCHFMRDKFMNRANFHLARTGGKFSVEGVTWHVRVHSAYGGELEDMLTGSMNWPDLVTEGDFTMFLLGLCDLAYSDVEPLIDSVVLRSEYTVLTHESGKHLVDY